MAQNAEAEQLLAAGKQKEALAQKLRSNVAVKLQAAADDEAAATAAEREGHLLNLRALQLLKDANKERACFLRFSARKAWTEAYRKFVDARNTELKAAQCKHNAEELLKGAAQLKDQASVAASLQTDASAQAAEAQTLGQAAATEKAEAEKLNQRAAVVWGQAERADPETMRRVAPAPPKPELRPVTPH